MEGEETFEPSFLGTADEVVEERIADDAVIMIKGTKTSSAVSGLGAEDWVEFFCFKVLNH
jgi:T-complex protein 1 subunit alpha